MFYDLNTRGMTDAEYGAAMDVDDLVIHELDRAEAAIAAARDYVEDQGIDNAQQRAYVKTQTANLLFYLNRIMDELEDE